jgi:threonine dehydrogenase-like Zn-dependent dehydrogenase
VTTAKAMVLEKFNAPLVEREIEVPALAAGETLVRITASGVCGSDVHMHKGQDPRTPLPMILGHESVGVVEETSGEVAAVDGTVVTEGMQVAWDRGVYCGRCPYCTVKRQQYLCPSRKAYGIHYGGTEPPPLRGGYASHIVLRAGTRIFPVAEDVDMDFLVACTCSGATSAHSLEEADVEPGDVVVVIGAGPVGLWTMALAHSSGADVIAIEPREGRLALAEEMGASVTLDPTKLSTEERKQVVMDRTGGLGADVVIDTTGVAALTGEGLSLVRRGGTYELPGIAVPVGEYPVALYEQLAVRNVAMKGIWVSDTRHFAQALAVGLSGRYPLNKLVTHRFPLAEANAALEAAAGDPSAVKVVLKP